MRSKSPTTHVEAGRTRLSDLGSIPSASTLFTKRPRTFGAGALSFPGRWSSPRLYFADSYRRGRFAVSLCTSLGFASLRLSRCSSVISVLVHFARPRKASAGFVDSYRKESIPSASTLFTKRPRTFGAGALCVVRPAWALSCRCKSGRKEVILNEANRNCERATDRGKEAGSETAGRRTETGYEASASGASGQ